MSQQPAGGPKRGLPPIIFILLGLGALWVLQSQFAKLLGWRPSLPTVSGVNSILPGGSGAGGNLAAQYPRQQSVPAGTTITIDGSTSMVLINQALKATFLQAYPGTVVNTSATGSDNGIQALLGGSVTLAALSRPLTAEEQQRGLVAVPVAKDRIAIVVGIDNPFRRGLSSNQLVQIFRGEITDWATFGGVDRTIRVLNRPSVSGTHKAFQSIVLGGKSFGTTPNIKTLVRDATTPMLQQLGVDGIGYATYGQVADQRTVRVVAIDGSTPEADAYPFQRPLFYAYRQPADPAVKAFLGLALSEAGKTQIATSIKGP
jgi:phosphate transport system substrate-binding protein